MIEKVTTSDRLKQIMSERGLTQADILRLTEPLQKKLDVKLNKSDLCYYVSGKFEPKQDKLTLLGVALDVNEAWLMGFDVPRERKEPSNDDVILYNEINELADQDKEIVRSLVKSLKERNKK